MINKLLFSLFLLIPLSVLAEDKKMTVFELNIRLLAFSDNYQESVSETVDTIIAEGVSPSSRLMFQTVKVFYTNSAIGIATESDAIHQLLDMMVMLRLQRLVWEKGADPTISTSEQAKKMAFQLEKLENQLHKIAQEIFSQADINRVISLAERWKKENPARQYVAFVRFQDFANSEDKAEIQTLLSKGGFFSSISDTNIEIEQTRYAIERGMFLANRMPIMMEWQAELFLYKALATNEIMEILEQNQKLVEIFERITTQVEALPSHIDTLVNNNSKVLLALSQSLTLTSDNLRVISEQMSPLFLNEDNNNDGEIDLAQVQLIFKDALATSKELASISKSLSDFSYNEDAANHLSGLVAMQLNQADSLIQNQFKQADELLAKRLEVLDEKLISHREIVFEQMFKLMLMICIGFPCIFLTGYFLVKRNIINYERRIESKNA